MEELHFGKLSIRNENSFVTFIVHGKGDTTVRIRADHIPDIIEFLKEKSGSETNRRSAFRIDLQHISPSVSDRFRVTVGGTQGDLIEVTPVKVSLTGMLVETRQDIGITGSHTLARLSLDNTHAILGATIVRSFGCAVAFYFTRSVVDGQLDPPHELVSICRSLETAWLKTRIG